MERLCKLLTVARPISQRYSAGSGCYIAQTWPDKVGALAVKEPKDTSPNTVSICGRYTHGPTSKSLRPGTGLNVHAAPLPSHATPTINSSLARSRKNKQVYNLNNKFRAQKVGKTALQVEIISQSPFPSQARFFVPPLSSASRVYLQI